MKEGKLLMICDNIIICSASAFWSRYHYGSTLYRRLVAYRSLPYLEGGLYKTKPNQRMLGTKLTPQFASI